MFLVSRKEIGAVSFTIPDLSGYIAPVIDARTIYYYHSIILSHARDSSYILPLQFFSKIDNLF